MLQGWSASTYYCKEECDLKVATPPSVSGTVDIEVPAGTNMTNLYTGPMRVTDKVQLW